MSDRFVPEFELYVLLAVQRLGEAAFGLGIRRCIEERTGRQVSVGALYTTLARLESKGLLEVHDPEAGTGRRGRPRKYCSLTPAGQRAMAHSMTMLTRMADGLALESTEGGAS